MSLQNLDLDLHQLRRAWRSSSEPLIHQAPRRYADLWFGGVVKQGGTFYALMGRHVNGHGQKPDLTNDPFIKATDYFPVTETDLVSIINVAYDDRQSFEGVEAFREQVRDAAVALWGAIHDDTQKKERVAYGYGLTSGSNTARAQTQEPRELGEAVQHLLAA